MPIPSDPHINLAIVGHVDSGKSTLIGIFLVYIFDFFDFYEFYVLFGLYK
jgi:translation elongation factor EF-1alpha